MKALSIHQPYAACVVYGQKSVEVRTWQTKHRGDLLICSTARKFYYENDVYLSGFALGVVTIADCVPLERQHLKSAMIDKMTDAEMENCYAWILTNQRFINPIPVKGKQGLWTFADDSQIEVIQEAPKTHEELMKFYHSDENRKIIDLWRSLTD